MGIGLRAATCASVSLLLACTGGRPQRVLKRSLEEVDDITTSSRGAVPDGSMVCLLRYDPLCLGVAAVLLPTPPPGEYRILRGAEEIKCTLRFEADRTDDDLICDPASFGARLGWVGDHYALVFPPGFASPGTVITVTAPELSRQVEFVFGEEATVGWTEVVHRRVTLENGGGALLSADD